MATLKRGSNKIVAFPIYASDGTTPKNVSDFSYVSAQVIQFKRLLASYVLGTDDEITSADAVVSVEIDIALSESFKEGPVSVRLILDETDADYTEDGKHRCTPEEETFTVER